MNASHNHTMTTNARLGLGRASLLAAGLMISAGTPVASAQNGPDTFTIQGTVRDFIRFDREGGHPDFQQYNTGHLTGLVEPLLDDQGKPVWTGSQGQKVRRQCRDSQGRNINPAFYDQSLGDSPPDLRTFNGTAITSAESFSQWYRDTPGVNLSMTIPITLERIPDTDIYFFHAHDDRSTGPREGFFPIDNDLYADIDPTYLHNYFFTFELDTEFLVQKNSGQVFTFYGDDDVWVFIDGKLVIDIGGVHGAVRQSIEIDRLDWLEDGQRVSLKLFFAERHTTRSNFRMETNLILNSVEGPPTTALYD